MLNVILFNLYTLLAIGVVALLIAVFFITYVLNKRTPLPKGCEDIKISDDNCLQCGNMDCHIKQGIDLKKIEEEIKEELKEEQE